MRIPSGHRLGLPRVAVLVAALAMANCATATRPDPSHSVVLSDPRQFAVADLARRCVSEVPDSGAQPEAFWQPTPGDVADLEGDMWRALLLVRTTLWTDRTLRLNHFYYQYIGVVVKGERLICVNAIDERATLDNDWRREAVICDDTKPDENWVALYDLSRRSFTLGYFSRGLFALQRLQQRGGDPKSSTR